MSRTTKLFNKKRPQLRRCAFCDKHGHNKSTCAEFLDSITKPSFSSSAVAPIKFFVHHVSHPPVASAHIVNLKKETSPTWHNVATIAPEKNRELDFNAAYEKIKQEIQSSKIIEPKDINQKIFATLPKPNERKKHSETLPEITDNDIIHENIQEEVPITITSLPPELLPKKIKIKKQSTWSI